MIYGFSGCGPAGLPPRLGDPEAGSWRFRQHLTEPQRIGIFGIDLQRGFNGRTRLAESRLAGESSRQVHPGRSVARVRGDRGAEERFCFLVAALLAEQRAQIVGGIGIAGRRGQCIAKVLFGGGRVASARTEVAQTILRLREAWPELNRRFERGPLRILLARETEGVGQVVFENRIVGPRRHGFAIQTHCRLCIAALQRLVGLARLVGSQRALHFRLRALLVELELGLRLVLFSKRPQRLRQFKVRVSLIGIESHGLLELLAGRVVLLCVEERHAQLVAHIVVVRIDGRGGLQMLDGVSILLRIHIHQPRKIQRVEVIGVRGQHLPHQRTRGCEIVLQNQHLQVKQLRVAIVRMKVQAPRAILCSHPDNGGPANPQWPARRSGASPRASCVSAEVRTPRPDRSARPGNTPEPDRASDPCLAAPCSADRWPIRIARRRCALWPASPVRPPNPDRLRSAASQACFGVSAPPQLVQHQHRPAAGAAVVPGSSSMERCNSLERIAGPAGGVQRKAGKIMKAWRAGIESPKRP